MLRTIQYFARFYSWYLFRTNCPTKQIVPWDVAKKQLGLIRKAMRLGKNVEHFKAAAVAADSKGLDPVLKTCAVGRQLGYATYLTLDMATFVSPRPRRPLSPPARTLTVRQLDAAGIRPSATAKRLQRGAYRAWIIGISFNIVGGLYTLYQLRQRESAIDKKDGEGVVEHKKLVRERNATNLQLLSDICDWTAPGSALGYVGFDEGIVGLAGTTSSLIGLWGAWKKTA